MAKAPNLLERAAFQANVAPALILDTLGAASLRLVHLGLKLGVFEALREPAAPEALAKRLGTDPRATTLLLETLAAAGYLARRGERFGNTPLTTRWLLADARGGMAPFVAFWERIVFPFWEEHLDAVMRQGRPPLTLYQWMDRHPGTWPLAQAWFASLARGTRDEVVRRAALPPGTATLLDVGGGHGLYSEAFAAAQPGLRATLLDLPASLKVAEATLAGSRVRDRIALRAGDYTRDDLGAGYDAALLFNVVHAHTPAENQALLRKVAASLRPGGRVLVLEQLRGAAPGPVVRATLEVVGFNYLAVLGGQAYRKPDLAAWLEGAGFGRARFLGLRSSPGNTLVVAEKPGQA